MAEITVNYGGSTSSSPTLKQQVAPVALLPGQPLSMGIGGTLIPATFGSVVAYAPVTGAMAGSAYMPQGTNLSNHPSILTAGTDYYVQPDGTIGATATARYAGTAIDSQTLYFNSSQAITSAITPTLNAAVDARVAALRAGTVTAFTFSAPGVSAAFATIATGIHAHVIISDLASTAPLAAGTVIATLPVTARLQPLHNMYAPNNTRAALFVEGTQLKVGYGWAATPEFLGANLITGIVFAS